MSDTTTGSPARPAARATTDLQTRILYATAAITLTPPGYLHAQLYLDGYRFIHAIGVMFLIQAAASFGLATLLLAAAVLPAPTVIQPSPIYAAARCSPSPSPAISSRRAAVEAADSCLIRSARPGSCGGSGRVRRVNAGVATPSTLSRTAAW